MGKRSELEDAQRQYMVDSATWNWCACGDSKPAADEECRVCASLRPDVAEDDEGD